MKKKRLIAKTDRILALLLIILAIGILIYLITVPKTSEKFTEFFILNSTSGRADSYPIMLKMESSTTLLVGVINHEYSIINYTLQIYLDKDIIKFENFTVKNNEIWEKNITFEPDKKGNDMKLEFLLFKENNFTYPYRELHLWVNIT